MMSKLKYLITLFLLLTSMAILPAADNDSIPENGDNILFFKDPRVDVLQKMYMRKTASKKQAIRVQVFQAATRDQIFDAKAQFSARYPGIATYVTYASPNFRLRVGEFETQNEAFKFMQQVKHYFPASFVIEEKGASEDKAKK
ncbi:MAG TPA: SPOR domain-containing protein [Chitinophagales bacterium]|nr:SPOR domain-containing protein [Chitinophagales bacterium]HQG39070.1 SPOR domain-containing protein [Chitinophagales bacterium]